MTNQGVSFGFLSGAARPDELAVLESLCFDTLWVGGHVASRNPAPEVIVQLARLAALTSRVRIGTSALLLPLYPPAIVAKQIADLDRVSGGRVALGVGVGGEYPAEFEACGVPLHERGSRTDEAIPLLRRLWSAQPVTHSGKHFSMTDVRIHPAPAQPGGPPIIVAGRAPVAMRRAAALGDGWMPYLYSPERYARSVIEIRSHAEQIGRDLQGFQWTAFVMCNVNASSGRARAESTEFLGGMFRQDVGPFLDRVAAVGTPAEVAARLDEFVAAGARHLLIAPARTGDPVDLALRFAGEVAPLLGRVATSSTR